MVRIELEPLEQKDLLEILDYALEQKKLNRSINKGSYKWDDYEYWRIRVSQLKQTINGKCNIGIYKSSLGTLDSGEKNIYEKNYKKW